MTPSPCVVCVHVIPSGNLSAREGTVGADLYLRPAKKRTGNICNRLIEYIFSYWECLDGSNRRCRFSRVFEHLKADRTSQQLHTAYHGPYARKSHYRLPLSPTAFRMLLLLYKIALIISETKPVTNYFTVFLSHLRILISNIIPDQCHKSSE
jgi:hypothetical protein